MKRLTISIALIAMVSMLLGMVGVASAKTIGKSTKVPHVSYHSVVKHSTASKKSTIAKHSTAKSNKTVKSHTKVGSAHVAKKAKKAA